jgi:long-chain fatty acid transport protein
MPKNLRYLPIVGSFLTMLLTLPCISQAGGLYLNEFGTPSMGVAGAGATAVASDASTSFHNPAGMTRIKGRELRVCSIPPSNSTRIPTLLLPEVTAAMLAA